MFSSVFNKKIPKNCSYCKFARKNEDMQLIFCEHKGPVSDGVCCSKYVYDPLKRNPNVLNPVSDFTKEDFIL